jgi:hypothetical protein
MHRRLRDGVVWAPSLSGRRVLVPHKNVVDMGALTGRVMVFSEPTLKLPLDLTSGGAPCHWTLEVELESKRKRMVCIGLGALLRHNAVTDGDCSPKDVLTTNDAPLLRLHEDENEEKSVYNVRWITRLLPILQRDLAASWRTQSLLPAAVITCAQAAPHSACTGDVMHASSATASPSTEKKSVKRGAEEVGDTRVVPSKKVPDYVRDISRCAVWCDTLRDSLVTLMAESAGLALYNRAMDDMHGESKKRDPAFVWTTLRYTLASNAARFYGTSTLDVFYRIFYVALGHDRERSDAALYLVCSEGSTLREQLTTLLKSLRLKHAVIQYKKTCIRVVWNDGADGCHATDVCHLLDESTALYLIVMLHMKLVNCQGTIHIDTQTRLLVPAREFRQATAAITDMNAKSISLTAGKPPYAYPSIDAESRTPPFFL